MYDINYSMLMDNGSVPAYRCPVCGNISLVREHDASSDNAPEVCRCCGALILGGSNLDCNSWNKVWHDHGSKVLWDMPVEERVRYHHELMEEYSNKHIYIPGKSDLENLTIEERAFTQNFFKKVVDNDKQIVVKINGTRYSYPYVTNTIFIVGGDRKYMAVCEKYGSKVLFLSDEFQYNENVYRTAYIGLLPDVFSLSMPLDEPCEVEDYDGNKYEIFID
jgi:predicted RNA-binding Zn-ribbon protein involved in translation (DUF1610 family)